MGIEICRRIEIGICIEIWGGIRIRMGIEICRRIGICIEIQEEYRGKGKLDQVI